jgi:hypothetical protein
LVYHIAVALWARGLGLELSIPKCHTMTYTRSNERVMFTYTIYFKALKLLGFVKRISAEFKLSSSLKRLYCSFVRSVLEYGVIIWDPCTLDGSSQLERVQRKFLKFAAFALRIECQPHEYQPVLQCLLTGGNKLIFRSLLNL